MTVSSDRTSAADRVMARCDELARVSSMAGGIRRVYLSPEHARVNALAGGWMREVGMETWQDAAGNQRGRIGSADKPLLILGSHLDTVVDAGRFDGIVGVLMAIETVGRLRSKIDDLPFSIEVIAFSDEEGTRFGRALMGSSAVAGIWDAHWWDLADADGITLAEAFEEFGLDPVAIADAAHTADEVVGYLEAHIEQGPYLERADQALGVVTSIASARRFQLEVIGEARHAGGTPYELRRDALVGASEAVLAVERISRERHQIGTVGQMTAVPGGVNIIPGRARFSLDLRGEYDETRDTAWEAISAALDEICERRGLRWESREIHRASAVFCAPHLMDAVRAGIRSTGEQNPLELFSKAGHDAMSLGELTDVAMIFLRNPGGISHHPDESVSRDDVALGIDALAETVRRVAAG